MGKKDVFICNMFVNPREIGKIQPNPTFGCNMWVSIQLNVKILVLV